MEKQFDAQEFMERANVLLKEIRKSESYPVIAGGVAGGIAGALMAIIVAGMFAPRRSKSEPLASDGPVTSRAAWSPKDVVQLATVFAGLAQQIQAWYKERRR